MSDFSGGSDWDDEADVICVGSGPGVLAYGLCCAAADLDVLFLAPPSVPDGAVADFTAVMTDGLADVATPDPGGEIAVGDRPGSPLTWNRPGRAAALEPFVGEHLRQWSARCLASASGVMFSQVPDLLVPMTDSEGRTITAAVLGPDRAGLPEWLREQAGDPHGRLATIVFGEGRIAGVQLADGSRVAANGGVAFSVGPATPDWPSPPEADLDVALVGRPAGHFARIEFFRR